MSEIRWFDIMSVRLTAPRLHHFTVGQQRGCPLPIAALHHTHLHTHAYLRSHITASHIPQLYTATACVSVAVRIALHRIAFAVSVR